MTRSLVVAWAVEPSVSSLSLTPAFSRRALLCGATGSSDATISGRYDRAVAAGGPATLANEASWAWQHLSSILLITKPKFEAHLSSADAGRKAGACKPR